MHPHIQDPPEPTDHPKTRPSPVEETKQIELVQDDDKKVVSIGTGLVRLCRHALITS